MATQSTKPIVLYTQGTPNGISASVFLEELKEQYGSPDYEPVAMNLRDADIGKVHNQVKSPWFLEINPNGKIPAITHEGFPVFETSAILLYLGAQFDKEHIFARDPVSDPKGYSQELQWLFFVHGGIGPMQGQAGHFAVFAPEKIEVKRLFSVLETRLKGREYLLDAGYGIADIKTWAWVRSSPRLGIALDEFPNVKAWIDRIEARPAVQRGIDVPKRD